VDQAPQSSAQHARLHHDHVSPGSLSTRSRTVAPSQRQPPSFGGPRRGPAPSASAPRHTRDQGTAHAATPEAAPRGAAGRPHAGTRDWARTRPGPLACGREERFDPRFPNGVVRAH
jgi:hypothetical protein